jgi:hypothetical protein
MESRSFEKKAKMELIDRVFSQKIADKYTNLKLFSTNFAPIISTKRIIPRMRWLELVYAMPYLVLRREILNSFRKTKNVFASVKQIWNFLVRFEFPLSWHREIAEMQDARCKMQVKPEPGIQYPASFYYLNLVKSRGFYFESSSMELAQPVSHETTRIETESEFTNYQLPIVTQQQPLVVSHKSSAVSYRIHDFSSLSGTSDFIAPIFRSYSFKPTSFLSQQAVPEKQRGAAASNLQKSDTVLHPYGHLEKEVLPNGQKIFSSFESSSMALAQPVSHEITRKETESAFTNYPLPLVTQQLPVVSHTPSAVSYKNRDISSLSGTSDFIAPLFRSYSFKPTSFLSQKTVPNEQLQKSDTVLPPYGHLERVVLPNGQKIFSSFESSSMALAQPVSHETTRKETESAFSNYRLPLVTQQPPVVTYEPSAVSNKNLVTYIPSGTSDFINRSSFNIINKKNEQMQLGIKKAPIYQVIEKEDRTPHATPQLPSIDVNRLADQIYQVIERRVRIERERRGL